MSDRARNQADRLRRPEFAELWRRARERIERDPSGWRSGTVTVPIEDQPQRVELEALLGREARGSTLRVVLGEVEDLLIRGPLAMSLPDWLERLGPALRDRPQEKADRSARLIEVSAVLQTSRHAADPWFERWLLRLGDAGTLLRLDTQRRLDVVRPAVRVLDLLPAVGVARAQLAADVTGDPKALDGGPLPGLVLSALATWADVAPPIDALDVAALWERFDVYGDDLASQVLALGLRPSTGIGDAALAVWLRAAAEDGHPVVLTRRDIGRGLSFSEVRVFCCENPSIMHAAARRLGARCPPLLCTNGRPHAAFWRVGEALVSAGAQLRYHGDLDPVGVDIAGAVMGRLGASPWRMSASDYDEALARVPEVRWQGGVAPRTPWDPALAARIAATGRAVFEEHVVEFLMQDLEAEADRHDASRSE